MLINKAVQDIGMGTYNWQLFVLCGFGWFADKYVSYSHVPRMSTRDFLLLLTESPPNSLWMQVSGIEYLA